MRKHPVLLSIGFSANMGTTDHDMRLVFSVHQACLMQVQYIVTAQILLLKLQMNIKQIINLYIILIKTFGLIQIREVLVPLLDVI